MNRIAGLQRADGSVCANADEDKDEVQNFYQQLYESQGASDCSVLLSHVPSRVTPAMSEFLDRPYEAVGVRTTLFQMSPPKARV